MTPASRTSAIPDLDVARVERFCRERIPERLRDQIRLDVGVVGRRVTITERRAPWSPKIGPEWTSLKIAQLRLHATDGTWTLYWADRNDVWHLDGVGPATQIDRLLAHLADDPASRYWG